jgi:uncharacterized membrane protein
MTAGIFAFAKKNAGRAQRLWVAAAIGAGTAGAIVLAVLRLQTRLINREKIQLVILPVLAFAGVIFILLAFGLLRKKMPRLYANFLGGTSAIFCGLLLFHALPDIFLYTAEFSMAGESVFSTDALFKAIGWAAGLLLTGLTAISFYQTTLGLREPLTGIFLSAGCLILIANQSALFIQLLMARRILPVTDLLFDVLIPVINHGEYFIYGIMLATLLIPFVLFARNLRPRLTGANPAENRKLRAGARRLRRWSALAVLGCAAGVFCLTVVADYNEREVVLSPAESMDIVGEEIRVPIEQVDDGHLHRFAYNAEDGTEVRFIVVKKSSASFGVGLDACDICGATGYYERKNEVICKLCDVVMNKQTIGFKGGCNPVPLAFAMDGGNMVVQISDLEKEVERFQ